MAFRFRAAMGLVPHTSVSDYAAMTGGWFVPIMPDLNQRNLFVVTYLIQNSIWWIEYVGLNGIRQDTWFYTYKYILHGEFLGFSMEQRSFRRPGSLFRQDQ